MNRCENFRSCGYDPTGERAVECNALASVECANCGYLCGECLEDSSCCSEGHKVMMMEETRHEYAIAA